VTKALEMPHRSSRCAPVGRHRPCEVTSFDRAAAELWVARRTAVNECMKLLDMC
jgi:hypothetical protein